MIINFWENVLRYPRFFISIIIGLFSIIISPIVYFLNKSNNLGIKIVFLISLIIIVIVLLTNIIEY